MKTIAVACNGPDHHVNYIEVEDIQKPQPVFGYTAIPSAAGGGHTSRRYVLKCAFCQIGRLVFTDEMIGHAEIHTPLESGPSRPDDDLWLDAAKQMVTASIPNILAASTALMTAIGVVEAIYLGILGFAAFTPANSNLWLNLLFVIPAIIWLVALYLCVQVQMTKEIFANLYVPDEIKENAKQRGEIKQGKVQLAYWLFTIGLALALVLISCGRILVPSS